jgi:hypothetical protein
MMRPGLPFIIAAAAVYAAVALGLYVARSGWVAILLYHAVMVLALLGSGQREPFRRVLTGWKTAALVPAMLTTAVVGPAFYVLWPYIDATPNGLHAELREFGLGGVSWIAFAVYYATIHPLLEELFWRGRPGGSRITPDWRDVAFAGYHVLVLRLFIGPVWIGLSFVVLVLTSWLWRLATRRFGGLGVALTSHAVADASIVVAATFIARAG